MKIKLLIEVEKVVAGVELIALPMRAAYVSRILDHSHGGPS
jgi:hypothetical protein